MLTCMVVLLLTLPNGGIVNYSEANQNMEMRTCLYESTRLIQEFPTATITCSQVCTTQN